MHGKKTTLQPTTLLKTHDHIQAPLWLSFRSDPALSIYPQHGHAWAEFIYAFHGIMEVRIDHIDYIVPPPYGLWLPAHVKHRGLNRTAVTHGTLYIHESLCHDLPKNPGILLNSPLVTAIFEHLYVSSAPVNSDEHQRLLMVLIDQLKQAQLVSRYLPSTSHPALKILLEYLHQHPADQSALKTLATQINMSERTLARLSQQELGMSLHEWRQRLKVIKAISLLNQKKTIEQIGLDLGYSSASAFISVFKRWMQMTPDQFRKSHRPMS